MISRWCVQPSIPFSFSLKPVSNRTYSRQFQDPYHLRPSLKDDCRFRLHALHFTFLSRRWPLERLTLVRISMRLPNIPRSKSLRSTTAPPLSTMHRRRIFQRPSATVTTFARETKPLRFFNQYHAKLRQPAGRSPTEYVRSKADGPNQTLRHIPHPLLRWTWKLFIRWRQVNG